MVGKRMLISVPVKSLRKQEFLVQLRAHNFKGPAAWTFGQVPRNQKEQLYKEETRDCQEDRSLKRPELTADKGEIKKELACRIIRRIRLSFPQRNQRPLRCRLQSLNSILSSSSSPSNSSYSSNSSSSNSNSSSKSSRIVVIAVVVAVVVHQSRLPGGH